MTNTESIEYELRKWETQLFIVNREIVENSKIYSVSELQTFAYNRDNLINTIHNLKGKLSNDK